MINSLTPRWAQAPAQSFFKTGSFDEAHRQAVNDTFAQDIPQMVEISFGRFKGVDNTSLDQNPQPGAIQIPNESADFAGDASQGSYSQLVSGDGQAQQFVQVESSPDALKYFAAVQQPDQPVMLMAEVVDRKNPANSYLLSNFPLGS